MPGRLPAGLSRRKYAALLVLLLVVLAIETFTGAERLRSDALRAVLTVAIWIIVFDRARERGGSSLRLPVNQWGEAFRRGGARSPAIARGPGTANVVSLECGLGNPA